MEEEGDRRKGVRVEIGSANHPWQDGAPETYMCEGDVACSRLPVL